jgi:hypothetical protein
MEKWKYKSLEWIHKVREEDYTNTKDLLSRELIEKTRKATEETIKSLGLKIVEPKEQVRTH